ncbi:MAG: hypothetical protein PVI90_19300, partial [Desulfobacteraceae bacterium]
METIRIRRQRALQRLVARLTHKLDNLLLQSGRLSSLRFMSFLFSLILLWLVEYSSSFLLRLCIPATGFICFGLVVGLHYRVQVKIEYYRAWLKIKKGQLAQINLDWDNLLHKHSQSKILS